LLHRLVSLLFVLAVAAACGDGSRSADTPAPSASPTEIAPRPTAYTTPIPTSPPAPLAIVNGTLIDGTGADPIPDAYVLVRDGRIEAADCCASAIHLPPDYEVIDVAGGTIMPGLVDVHVHITSWLLGNEPGAVEIGARDRMLPWLQAGFTTLRDLGTVPSLFPSVTQSVDNLEAEALAPRVVWAGPIITAVGGYPVPVPAYAPVAQEVASTEESRVLVNRLADDGARVVKLGLEQGYYSDLGWPLLTVDTVRAIVDEAHGRGLRVTAHVTSLDELGLALDGGVDDLAHAPLESIPDDVIREMVAQGIGMATTATVWGRAEAQRTAATNAKRLADAGGVVAVATDFGCCQQVPGIEPYLDEMRWLLTAGMTPMQVIVAATKGASELSGRHDSGTIEPGKFADLIILGGDPLAQLNALRDVDTVIQAGRIVVQ